MLLAAGFLPIQRSHPSSLKKKTKEKGGVFQFRRRQFSFFPWPFGEGTLMVTLLSLCWCRTCRGRAVGTPGTPTAASPTTPWKIPPTSPAPSPSSGSMSTACLHQVSPPRRGHRTCLPGLEPGTFPWTALAGGGQSWPSARVGMDMGMGCSVQPRVRWIEGITASPPLFSFLYPITMRLRSL